MRRHIEGAFDTASLTSLPEDIFDSITSLFALQIAVHQHLRRLPSLQGLVNLRTLLFILLLELEEMRPFTSLAKLERLTMSPNFASRLGARSGSVLAHNEFIDSQCDLSKLACSLEPA